MNEEQGWLIALATDQLAAACQAASIKVDGFRHLQQVPRLLLQRQIITILTKQRGYGRTVRLRTALAALWRERYAALAERLKSGPPTAAAEGEEVAEAPSDWLAELCRVHGRAPVQMGLQVEELPWATGEELSRLIAAWPADLPLVQEPAEPVASEAAADPATESESLEGEPAPMVESERPDWRQERAQLRARLKSQAQEIRELQRARTSAEHRAAHYIAQVEQVRTEMEALTNRTDWPQPRQLVQRLIRGLMGARQQILDLERSNAELREALGQGTEEPAE